MPRTKKTIEELQSRVGGSKKDTRRAVKQARQAAPHLSVAGLSKVLNLSEGSIKYHLNALGLPTKMNKNARRPTFLESQVKSRGW